MGKIASIDLGTNTFHLLIVDFIKGEMVELYRDRVFVNLAEDGIDFITERVQKRIYQTIKKFKETLLFHKVEEYRATGTAALRTASNGPEIINFIQKEYDIQIELITGKKEADLIYKGTKLAYNFDHSSYLIMDIGGGSVEFIVVQNGILDWSQSFPLGVSVLHNKFKGEDPYPDGVVSTINEFLNDKLSSLLEVLEGKSIKYLIGASGSFDVIEHMISDKQVIDKCLVINRNQKYRDIYDMVVGSSEEERNQIETIPKTRVKLMPMAMILIEFVALKIIPEAILVSPYAMKEGVLQEMSGKL